MPSTKRYQNQKAADALANALLDLPENWLVCRDVRHAWDVVTDFHVVGHQGKTIQHIRRTLTCLRCNTLREERYVLGRSGLDKIGQSYKYPEHYQLKGIPRGNKPSSIIQAEQFRRAMEKVVGSQGLQAVPDADEHDEAKGA